jgi:glycosyltransferase involved in cell wall biosynthesis
VRIAYVVSRFPLASETFIVRELNAIDGRDGIEIELRSLFSAARPFAHPDAKPWLGRVQRPSIAGALSATVWWGLRRPAALSRCAAKLLRAYWRRPRILVRALATLPLAAWHARGVQRVRCEHVHAHFATYPAITAWVCGRLTGVSYSITAHAHDLFVDRSFLTTLVGEASFVATISEFNRRLLAPYAAASRTPVNLVRCGVDPRAYTFRARALPRSGPVRALCVASLEEYKGHRTLLDALGGSSELQRVELELVGGGSLERQLRDQIGRLGLAGRVRLLGVRSEAEVAALLQRADVFVLASVVARDGQMEGIPVALMEALACGVPVIASRLSGIPELVQEGVTGVLAEPGNPDDLARAFSRLLADGQATRAYTCAGRELVEREFNLERAADALRELFLGLGREAHTRAPARA